MKKIIILLCGLLLITGCTSQNKTSIKDRITTIQEIDYATLTQKLEDNIDFLLYIGRPDCQDCQLFYPYLEEYVNQTQQGIYYLNIQSFRDQTRDETASQEEKTFYENLKKNLGYEWTPTLQRYQNGKKVSDFQFLDMSYYEIEDESQQQEKIEKAVNELHSWLDSNY